MSCCSAVYDCMRTRGKGNVWKEGWGAAAAQRTTLGTLKCSAVLFGVYQSTHSTQSPIMRFTSPCSSHSSSSKSAAMAWDRFFQPLDYMHTSLHTMLTHAPLHTCTSSLAKPVAPTPRTHIHPLHITLMHATRAAQAPHTCTSSLAKPLARACTLYGSAGGLTRASSFSGTGPASRCGARCMWVRASARGSPEGVWCAVDDCELDARLREAQQQQKDDQNPSASSTCLLLRDGHMTPDMEGFRLALTAQPLRAHASVGMHASLARVRASTHTKLAHAHAWQMGRQAYMHGTWAGMYTRMGWHPQCLACACALAWTRTHTGYARTGWHAHAQMHAHA
eukprot:236794-Chlamydomonas_euryale.AAC.9